MALMFLMGFPDNRPMIYFRCVARPFLLKAAYRPLIYKIIFARAGPADEKKEENYQENTFATSHVSQPPRTTQ